MSNDFSKQFQEQIAQAYRKQTAIHICGGNSKAFYGNPVAGETLNTGDHSGIIDYHPSELVVTVRSGTRLSELEAELKAHNQMLAFEPPVHSTATTIGGVIACNMSGPRRVSSGAARDYVLGATIINGKGEKLSFGGQVMKNVAGYDAARLMAGAQGCLGLLLDISLKVLPLPESEITLAIDCEAEQAMTYCRLWLKQGHALTASCYFDNTLYARFSSTNNAVKQSKRDIDNTLTETVEELDNDFWTSIKNQQHTFFQMDNLWRVSLPANTEITGSSGSSPDNTPFLEWNGALRWLHSDNDLFSFAREKGGHACRYPLHARQAHEEIFQPLEPPMLALQQRLKTAFDPEKILNPGRLYASI